MKKMMMALVCAASMLMLCSGALADEGIKIDGKIEAARTQTILAPYSGVVGDFTVRAGDQLGAGETLFAIRSTSVYADFDGTVTGLFAEPGDSTASVQDRYGALCYLERAQLYTADCTTTGAHSDNENRIIHVGEIVYIRSTSNNDRKGQARVTGVSGSSYTLEVTSEKDMRLNEQFKVYRDDGFASSSCIGTGKLRRIEPAAVTADGYVLGVYVAEGQRVSRGDLLFSIVPDALDGMQGGDGSVTMPQDGVVLSVLAESGAQIAKDAPMATYCPQSAVQLVCPVDEEDLEHVRIGAQVQVTLDAFRDAPFAGTILKIASASSQEGTGTSFDVTIGLEENENVRIGMNATAAL